jgi:transposase, IS30 family
MNQYKRLRIEDREEISRLLLVGSSFRSIARVLGRSPSTISREINRIKSGRNEYRAVSANRTSLRLSSSRRREKRKLILNKSLREVVYSKLNLTWSPEQIAQYLKNHYDEADMQISAESIYTYLYVFLRRPLREEFTKQLRHAHKKRRVRGRSAKGQPSLLKDMVSIDERPAEVNDRLIPGHWEGDLMIGGGRKQTAMGTLVERRTRYAILVPLKNKTSEEVRKEFAKEIKKLPKALRLSLTYDQGREMAQHKLFTKETKMQVYFAHPKSPWERGTNENTNGLLRQFFPKGTDFTKVTRQEMKKVQKLLNERPRQTLGFKTPAEMMHKLLR